MVGWSPHPVNQQMGWPGAWRSAGLSALTCKVGGDSLHVPGWVFNEMVLVVFRTEPGTELMLNRVANTVVISEGWIC